MRSFLPYSTYDTTYEADDVRKRIYHETLAIIVRIGTLPYYRLFNFNTLRPIELIASCTRRSLEPDRLLSLIDLWRRGKRAELQFVSIAVSYNSSQPPTEWQERVDGAYFAHTIGSHSGRSRHWFILLEFCFRFLLARFYILVLQSRIVNLSHPYICSADRCAGSS